MIFSANEVNDTINSENGDSEKVLATVVGILAEFLSSKPEASVFITGSTKSRTRLYEIAINTYLDDFLAVFEIFGGTKGIFEVFQKKNYESFLVRKIF